jgi:hypothetical protein
MDLCVRFRMVQDYAAKNGFVGGIPTFYTANYPQRVFGVLLLSAATCDWRDVPASQLKIAAPGDFAARMRAVQDYAVHWGYVGAVPTFMQNIANGETVYGTLLLKQAVVQRVDVAASALKAPADNDIGGRFRASGTYATSQHSIGGCPTFYQASRKIIGPHGPLTETVYGTLLFPPGSAERRDVAAAELDQPSLDDPAALIAKFQGYAVRNGFVGAIPTFFQADLGPGLVCGSVLVGAGAQFRDVAKEDLKINGLASDDDRLRAVQDYAKANGFVAGFPTYYQADRDGTIFFGTVLLANTVAQWRDVSFGDLGNPRSADGPARFRATQAYAVKNGSVGGFPTGFEAPTGGGVYGTILLHGPGAQFRDISATPLLSETIVGGAIRTRWQQLGGATGFLGLSLTQELPCAVGAGRHNDFDGGVIYFNLAGQCFEVHGAILQRWLELGAERSYLGYPISDEGPWTSPDGRSGRISSFERGQIAFLDAPIEIPQVFQPAAAVITAPSGTAFGGSVTISLKSNGDYTITYHLHDSGLVGYEFGIHVAFLAANGMALVDIFSGSVGGTVGSGSRDADKTTVGHDQRIADNWAAFASGKLIVTRDSSISGPVGLLLDIYKGELGLVAGASGLAIGLVIGASSVIGSLLPSLGPGEVIGVFEGIVVFDTGGGLLLATLSGLAATAITDALIATRRMHDQETSLADKVFKGTLSYDKIRITNVVGLGGRAFTSPGADGLIYLHLGMSSDDKPPYSDATLYSDNAYPVLGQLLIHELTHAWQIEHGFVPTVVCRGLVNQANYQVGDNVYQIPLGLAWSDYNLEAQGAVVDTWFGNGMASSDPYFTYIEDNIRAGRT